MACLTTDFSFEDVDAQPGHAQSQLWDGLHAAGKFRVQRMAQAIADQVDGQHCDGQTHARKEHALESNPYVGTALCHDIAPTGDFRWRTGAEEAEIRFSGRWTSWISASLRRHTHGQSRH